MGDFAKLQVFAAAVPVQWARQVEKMKDLSLNGYAEGTYQVSGIKSQPQEGSRSRGSFASTREILHSTGKDSELVRN